MSLQIDGITGPYTEKSPAFAKLHLVATVPTAQAIADITSQIGSAFLTLTAERIPITQKQTQLKLVSSQHDEFAKERDRWLEEMKQANLDGVKGTPRWEVINHNFQFEQKRCADVIPQMRALETEIRAMHFGLVKSAVQHSQALQPLLMPLIVAVRRELGVDTQIEAYAAILAKHSEYSQKRLAEFLIAVSPK